MPYDPDIHHRRSIRLAAYDYAQAGCYFVTINTYHFEALFGVISGSEMQLNALGQIVGEVWDALPNYFPHLELDAFIIMPNHVHGILVLTASAEQTPLPRRPNGVTAGSLGNIVSSFKSTASKRIHLLQSYLDAQANPNLPIWHRNYYEHVIRSERDLDRIRTYIMNNPANWEKDDLHPSHQPRIS